MNYEPTLLLSCAFDKFSTKMRFSRKKILPADFAQEFIDFRHRFFSVQNCDEFCAESDRLASDFIQSENLDYAGIIYSTVCKILMNCPCKLEYFAQMGYKVAEAKGDYVHMMARLNDLRKIYKDRPDKRFKYLQILYKQENCLKELTRRYDTAVKTYSSVQRKPAPKSDYEIMLAYVQTEIGKFTKFKHPHDALVKLSNARKIFNCYGFDKHVKYIDLLISDIAAEIIKKLN